ncbi:hypothetical protein [Massilia sp. LjRoot122]|uniref:hypothetical protein n=1 Tax=Massilia sp. LjRoot122 TaxID=3342257 RepID=UPI003ECC4C64
MKKLFMFISFSVALPHHDGALHSALVRGAAERGRAHGFAGLFESQMGRMAEKTSTSGAPKGVFQAGTHPAKELSGV